MKENTIDTAWLDGLIAEKRVQQGLKSADSSPGTGTGKLTMSDAVIGAALFRGRTAILQKESEILESLTRWQTYLREVETINEADVELTYQQTRYKAKVQRTGPELFSVAINGKRHEAMVRQQSDGALLCSWDDVSHRILGVEEPMGLRINFDGTTVTMPIMFDATELRSDVSGKVVRYLKESGDAVRKDEPYFEVESMKMFMTLKASEEGKISIDKAPGAVIQPGEQLASLELSDPSKATKLVAFEGQLAVKAGESVADFAEALSRLSLAMEGYAQESKRSLLVLTYATDAEALEEAVSFLIESYLNVQ
eukprot:Selendium_serpulae@DN6807_c0_g1_i1.p1